MKVAQDSNVIVEYKGTLEDGTVFDSSEMQGAPLTVQMGSKQLLPKFEAALMAMTEGQEKEFTLLPQDAYGEYNKELVRDLPRASVQGDQTPQVGMHIMLNTPQGQQVQAHIVGVTEDAITLDLNHPLAGKTLHFWIKIVKIN